MAWTCASAGIRIPSATTGSCRRFTRSRASIIFVTQKMSWNDTNQLPFKLFWWQSPDGSKVLTYFPHGYGNNNLNPVRLSADLVQARTMAPGLTEMMDLYGVGDHGGGPTRDVLDEGVRWMQPDKVAPKMEFGTAPPYSRDCQEADRAGFENLELSQHRRGLSISARSSRRRNFHSHVERRAVSGVSPRRLHDAGQS